MHIAQNLWKPSHWKRGAAFNDGLLCTSMQKNDKWLGTSRSHWPFKSRLFVLNRVVRSSFAWMTTEDGIVRQIKYSHLEWSRDFLYGLICPWLFIQDSIPITSVDRHRLADLTGNFSIVQIARLVRHEIICRKERFLSFPWLNCRTLWSPGFIASPPSSQGRPYRFSEPVLECSPSCCALVIVSPSKSSLIEGLSAPVVGRRESESAA